MTRPRTLAIGILCALACAGWTPAPGNGSLDVTILGTTDVHGHIYPTNYFGDKGDEPLGLARVATLIKEQRAKHPHTLLVDSGDSLQGTPLTYFAARVDPRMPNPMVAAYNYLKYDAFTMGNHEYNYGIDYIVKARLQANYPFLSGNIYFPGTLKPIYTPYVIKQVGGAKIGILGLTTPGIKIWDRHNVEGVQDFGDIIAAAKRWIPQMKAKGADTIVVTIHSGLGEPYDETYGGYAPDAGAPPENVCAKLADTFPDDISVILLGHSHKDLPKLVHHGVLLTQAMKWGQRLAVVDLHLEHVNGKWKVTRKDATTLKTDHVAPDPGLMAVTRLAHQRTLAYVNSPIGTSTGEWSARRSRTEDSAIMDLINEVQMAKTGADLSAASVFNAAAHLPKGKLTVADIASLYVYENTLTKIAISGKQLKEYLENSARYFNAYKPGGKIFDDNQPAYNHDMVSGVAYVIDVSKPVGQRISGLTYKGKPVADTQMFTMALNSYRQNGGGGYTMIKGAPVKQAIYTEIRELMLDYVKEKHQISPDRTFKRNWTLVQADKIAPDGEHYK
jgi:2',3'-cyclic-nucleotide 2'-phosphodiesterase/3'-nucleotidase